MREEHDLLGDREVPSEAYYGVHTLRAVENFCERGLLPEATLAAILRPDMLTRPQDIAVPK